MATLFDVTLDLARHARAMYRYKITDTRNNGRKLYSNKMQNVSGQFQNGTLWIMTGENAGKFSRIRSAVNDNLTIDDDSLYANVGDVVMICPWIDFDLDELVDAINSVLYRYPIYVWDTSLTWDPNKLVYDLPAGVSDVRQVKIANTLNNGTFTLSHCWLEENGQLRFHTAQPLYADGGEMQIGYRKMHGEIYEATDAINPAVDLNYLRNMAFLYLWRSMIITQHKDNPIAADMYNEAKVYESEYVKFNTPEMNIPLRSFFTR